jgi:glycosyltransferase involved in cell wall biosynthesis
VTRTGTVSVVIPVYNGERFLASAIASVRAQTHPATQVIVVDDGSTDGSAAVATGLARDWPALQVLSQPNAGPSAARNTGVARATGDFVTFLDAAAEMLPDRIAFQLAFLAEHPDADLVMGNEWLDVEDGVRPPDWLRLRVEGIPDPYVLSMMVRRPAFDRVGPFDPGRRLAEDVEWLFRARATGIDIAVIEHPFLRRRVHDANLTRDLTLAQMQGALLEIARDRVLAKRGGAEAMDAGAGRPGSATE